MRKFFVLAAAVSVTACQQIRLTEHEDFALICENAQKWRGQLIGDGHCVSLIKHCTGAPPTSEWRPGKPVQGNTLRAGTIIATFEGQLYPNRSGYHTAIYIRQSDEGIWVWDQWQGMPVHQRLIRWRNSSAAPANRGEAYRVARVWSPR